MAATTAPATPLDEHLEQINARLPNARPHAAYALGMLTVVHIETGKPIPTVLLDAAMDMTSLADAFTLGQRARDYAQHEPGRRRRRRTQHLATSTQQES